MEAYTASPFSPISNIVDKFNAVNSQRPAYTKLSALRESFHYKVKKLKLVPTRFGSGLIAEISGSYDSETQHVFLPKRFQESLTDQCIAELNTQPFLYISFNNLSGTSSEIECKLIVK